MSATKRFMNWSGVTFTPVGGQPTIISGVTSVAIESGGSLARFAGDGDRYITTMVNDFNEPTVTIQAADLASLRANPVGTVGVADGHAQRRQERLRDGGSDLHDGQRGGRVVPGSRGASPVRPGKHHIRRLLGRRCDQPAGHQHRVLNPRKELP